MRAGGRGERGARDGAGRFSARGDAERGGLGDRRAATLGLPRGDAVIEVEGIGPGGAGRVRAHARRWRWTGVAGGALPIAYGPPDALCATGKMS